MFGRTERVDVLERDFGHRLLPEAHAVYLRTTRPSLLGFGAKNDRLMRVVFSAT
jgi:hypothetical protein